jgi:hypothetical protein
MKLLISLVLAIAAYLVVGATLALAVQVAWPDALPVAERPPESLGALFADLGVQCIACGIAGACAMTPDPLRLRRVLVAVGGPVLSITVVSTIATWSAMPDWYDTAVIVLTFPFFAAGAAWRHTGRAARTVAS